jgi:ribose transport system permease protein
MEKNQESTFVKLIPFFEKYGILLLILIMVTVLHILQPDVFLSWRKNTNFVFDWVRSDVCNANS